MNSFKVVMMIVSLVSGGSVIVIIISGSSRKSWYNSKCHKVLQYLVNLYNTRQQKNFLKESLLTATYHKGSNVTLWLFISMSFSKIVTPQIILRWCRARDLLGSQISVTIRGFKLRISCIRNIYLAH